MSSKCSKCGLQGHNKLNKKFHPDAQQQIAVPQAPPPIPHVHQGDDMKPKPEEPKPEMTTPSDKCDDHESKAASSDLCDDSDHESNSESEDGPQSCKWCGKTYDDDTAMSVHYWLTTSGDLHDGPLCEECEINMTDEQRRYCIEKQGGYDDCDCACVRPAHCNECSKWIGNEADFYGEACDDCGNECCADCVIFTDMKSDFDRNAILCPECYDDAIAKEAYINKIAHNIYQ